MAVTSLAYHVTRSIMWPRAIGAMAVVRSWIFVSLGLVFFKGELTGLFCCCISTCVDISKSRLPDAINPRANLTKHLFEDYDPGVIPVASGEVLTVFYHFVIGRIDDLVSKREIEFILSDLYFRTRGTKS
jgi:hypothetical protein